jgi:hypothetical protein
MLVGSDQDKAMSLWGNPEENQCQCECEWQFCEGMAAFRSFKN